MRRILIVTCLAAACVLGASATGSARTTAGAPPCLPKMTKSAGKTTIVNCGPATATLKYKGKTYAFRNGFCSTSKAAGGALQLELGTLVLNAKGNAGKSYFSLGVTSKAGNHLGTGVISEADLGAKQILSETIVKPKGSVARATFTQYGTVPVSGSWNCHGVVYKGP